MNETSKRRLDNSALYMQLSRALEKGTVTLVEFSPNCRIHRLLDEKSWYFKSETPGKSRVISKNEHTGLWCSHKLGSLSDGQLTAADAIYMVLMYDYD